MPTLSHRSLPGRKLALTGVLALAAGLCLVLFIFDPGQCRFYPRCLLYQTTGLLCPGCGSLRAFHHLLHGQVLAAVHFNALLVLGIPVAAWLTARSLVCSFNGQPQSLGLHPRWLWFVLAAVILFGILRNLPFAHAAWLAP
jgi:hypothetical protein